LKELAAIDSPLIGDVRGKGLMIGVELIDEEGKPMAAARTASIFEGTKNRGVLIGKGGINGNVLRIKPPMCITKKDVDVAVAAIADAIKQGK
jgi:4-aminobutyrate aminotransferase-like enzyme